MDISLQDVVTAASILFGGGSGAVFILKSKNLITFGRATERREFTICQDHHEMANDIRRASVNIEDLTKAVNTLNDSVVSHLGYHKGKNGYKS